MQTRTAGRPYRWVRLSTIFVCLAFAVSIAVGVHWWNEARLPMTAERYTALCNDVPECYPEVVYAFGAMVMGIVALFPGFHLLLLGLSQAVKWLSYRLASR